MTTSVTQPLPSRRHANLSGQGVMPYRENVKTRKSGRRADAERCSLQESHQTALSLGGGAGDRNPPQPFQSRMKARIVEIQ